MRETKKVQRWLNLATVLNEERHRQMHEERSIFDMPVGVDENCLSARQIVNFIRGGASDDDLAHLIQCYLCLQSVRHLASLDLETHDDFISRALQIAENPDEVSTRLPKQDVMSVPLSVILGLTSRQFRVADATSNDLKLTFDVIPCFNRELLGRINMESLRIEGAIIANHGRIDKQVDINEDGQTDYLTVSFDNAKLSPDVRYCVASNQRVMGAVRLHGYFHGRRHKGFMGQANLEISG